MDSQRPYSTTAPVGQNHAFGKLAKNNISLQTKGPYKRGIRDILS